MSGTLPYNFGAGDLYAIPLSGTDLTPVHIGAHQGMTLNFKADIKTLFGQQSFALAAAGGKRESTIKFKSAEIDVAKWNKLAFGLATTAGQLQAAQNEAHAVPGSPYTVSPANLANFDTDLGVTYAATGQALKLTSSATPASIGTYHLNASNKYVMAAGDTGQNVNLNYLWKDSTTGATLTITNQPMGYAPQLKLVFTTILNGQIFTGKFNQAVSGSLQVETKTDDWMMGDLDVTCFCDASNTLATLTSTAA